MAAAISPISLSLIPATSSSSSSSSFSSSSSSSSSNSTRSSLCLPSTRFLRSSPLRRLGFVGAASDPLLSLHVASRLRSLKSCGGNASRGVTSMVKKSVGDLTEAELKGKKVFVRADLNVPLDDAQNITDDTRIRAAIPTVKHLIFKGAKVILTSHLVSLSPSLLFMITSFH